MVIPRYELKLTAQERVEFSQIFTLNQILLLDRDNRKRTIDGIRFERFVGYLFEQAGYNVWTTRRVGDGGVDLFVRKRALEYIVQCKRIEKAVVKPNDVWAIPNIVEGLGARKAFLVTTGGVSSNTKNQVVKKRLLAYIEKDELVKWARRGTPPHVVTAAEKSVIIEWLEKQRPWLANPKIALAVAFLVISLLFLFTMAALLFITSASATKPQSNLQPSQAAVVSTVGLQIPLALTPQIVTSLPNSAATSLPSATVRPSVEAEAAQPCQPGQVKGNANPGSGFYHEPGWFYYATVRPPEYTVRCFDNALTAQAAGFKRGDTRTANRNPAPSPSPSPSKGTSTSRP